MKIPEIAEIIWPETSSQRHSQDAGVAAGVQMVKQFCDIKQRLNEYCDRETLRVELM